MFSGWWRLSSWGFGEDLNTHQTQVNVQSDGNVALGAGQWHPLLLYLCQQAVFLELVAWSEGE